MSSVRQDELIEFYRELALLVRAGLPLPQSLAGLVAPCGDRRFRRILESVAADLEKGMPLSDALRRHPACFPELHLKLIQSGEASGTLPEVLHQITHLSQWQCRVGTQFAEIAAYPLITIAMAAGLMLLMLRYYLGEFVGVIAEIAEAPLPPFTRALFTLSRWVTAGWVPIVLLYLGAVAAVIWCGSSGRAARQFLNGLLRRFPGTRRAPQYLDTARVSAVWAALLQRNTPLPDILLLCASMAESPALQRGLSAVRADCEAGKDLRTAVAEGGLPQDLALALHYTDSRDLAVELEELIAHCLERAEAAAKKAALGWQVLTFAGMGVVAAIVIISFFLPMIQLYQQMVFD